MFGNMNVNCLIRYHSNKQWKTVLFLFRKQSLSKVISWDGGN